MNMEPLAKIKHEKETDKELIILGIVQFPLILSSTLNQGRFRLDIKKVFYH